MKLKFPKKIMVGDIEMLVKTDKSRVGAEFYFWDYGGKKSKEVRKGQMIIGTKVLEVNPIRVLCSIIHELKEAIQEIQCVRYKRPDSNESYEFHYDHKEHDTFCAMLAGLLSQFLD